MDQLDGIKRLISKKSAELHRQVGAVVDAFIVSEGLEEDALTLNIVFNALANNLRAIVENNPDIPPESVELMVQSVSRQIRKGYAERKSNQN